MIEVVLDTNVLISALRSRHGASQGLIRQLGEGRWRPNISVALALEYEEVIHRPETASGYSVAELNDFLDFVFAAGRLVPSVGRRRPNLNDPGDEFILELAMEVNAMIVTYNLRHFAGVERVGIQVLSPAELLTFLRGFK